MEPSTICDKCQLNLRNNKEIGKPSWHNAPGGQKYNPSYNISPGSFTYVCSSLNILKAMMRPVLVSNQFTDTKDKGHSLQVMRWGLIPAFIHGDSTSTFHTFNARIESLLDKRSYKCSLQEGKRCVVVVQGSLLMLEDPDKLLMMAGLFAHNYEKQAYQFLTDLADNLDNVSVIKYPVTSQVNNSTYNEPNCIKPISEEEEHK
ncbi:unnamed protein product [Schistosoma margrebowiei]|uniref:Abasic site processing protein HMCES n=1 Tax=Schistosoma margrebowiei TaxID=48269 RepID=A0A3P8A2P5_9TREM|nr:unnamed protein product [Schistosoma margrebowiei]